MHDKRSIEQAILEQKRELELWGEERICTRREEVELDLESPLAQVVIGVRRSGKSTLCFNALRKSGRNFGYANFDDERLRRVSGEDLNVVLEAVYKIYGKIDALFLDEIQNVDGWHLFVNRLLRQRLRLVITGSNAKLLSGELATHLTGRNLQIELLPFSFADYCAYRGIAVRDLTTFAEAQLRKAFDEYVAQGGFPELMRVNNRRLYVENLVDGILRRDIMQRHAIRHAEEFVRLAHHLMNVAPAVVAESELSRIAGGISNHTAGNYVGYLKQAYVLAGVKRYSQKSRNRVRGEKVYPIDVSLMDGRKDAMAGENLGWRLETVVCLELLRRNRLLGRDVYYFKDAQGHEADFVVCRGNAVEEAYQVCWDVSAEKTMKRELRGLLAAARGTRCRNLFLITDFHREEIVAEGYAVKIIPAYEWLASSVSPAG